MQSKGASIAVPYAYLQCMNFCLLMERIYVSVEEVTLQTPNTCMQREIQAKRAQDTAASSNHMTHVSRH